ncbi:MAG TPA: hypothetical protein VMU15_16975 [Anaeromyxobacter sp.]|nr:hypothetical protein [Anaeromyxobacter sp.]
MADPIENKHVDKRVAHRYVRKSVVEEKEYERYLKSLPDLAEQALTVEASMEGDDAADEPDEPEGGAGGASQP